VIETGRILIASGLAVACLGAVLVLAANFPSLRIGRLPGDIQIERAGITFYFPITTMILASAAISGVIWLMSRFRR
jgi:hypothetical protein